MHRQYIATDETLKKLDRQSAPLSPKEAAVIFKLASQLKPDVRHWYAQTRFDSAT